MSTVREAWDEIATRAGLSRVPPRVIVVVAVVAAIGCGWAVWQRPAGDATGFTYESAVASPEEADAANESASSEDPGTAIASPPENTLVVVHVAGAVLRPGIVQLASGARVADALEQAGGALEEAALDAVNLARVLADGEQIYIPTHDEVADTSGPLGAESNAQSSGLAPGTSGGDSTRVNINTADVAELDTLPGVGPSTAEKIVADREANGPFASPEDLMRVSGIGEKRFEELRDLISAQ